MFQSLPGPLPSLTLALSENGAAETGVRISDNAFWDCLITQDVSQRSSHIAKQQKQTSKYSTILTSDLTQFPGLSKEYSFFSGKLLALFLRTPVSLQLVFLLFDFHPADFSDCSHLKMLWSNSPRNIPSLKTDCCTSSIT